MHIQQRRFTVLTDAYQRNQQFQGFNVYFQAVQGVKQDHRHSIIQDVWLNECTQFYVQTATLYKWYTLQNRYVQLLCTQHVLTKLTAQMVYSQDLCFNSFSW